VTSQTSAE